MRGARLTMSADEVIKRCDENTIGEVPTLGTTYMLQYEPVRAGISGFENTHSAANHGRSRGLALLGRPPKAAGADPHPGMGS